MFFWGFAIHICFFYLKETTKTTNWPTAEKNSSSAISATKPSTRCTTSHFTCTRTTTRSLSPVRHAARVSAGTLILRNTLGNCTTSPQDAALHRHPLRAWRRSKTPLRPGGKKKIESRMQRFIFLNVFLLLFVSFWATVIFVEARLWMVDYYMILFTLRVTTVLFIWNCTVVINLKRVIETRGTLILVTAVYFKPHFICLLFIQFFVLAILFANCKRFVKSMWIYMQGLL